MKLSNQNTEQRETLIKEDNTRKIQKVCKLR